MLRYKLPILSGLIKTRARRISVRTVAYSLANLQNDFHHHHHHHHLLTEHIAVQQCSIYLYMQSRSTHRT